MATRSLGWFCATEVGVKGRKMRAKTSIQMSVVAAAAALSLWAGPAQAVQLAISQPADVALSESSLAFVPLVFELVNTGTPELKSIEFVSITQVVTPSDPAGDITREVLKNWEVGSCMSGEVALTRLAPTERCKITSTYIALDGDPFDENKVVDSATWLAGISVSYRFFGETALHSEVAAGLVTIKDDPIPEPATWATMLAGFAALGVALRYSRRPARAHRSDARPRFSAPECRLLA
jgi:PEP-CTERM motif